MSSDLAVSVNNVTKTYRIYERPQDRLKQSFSVGKREYYREFRALNNVSFEIPRGHTVGIIGRNGSGKSTLLQIIAGTLSPTAGQVNTSGRVAALLELGSGFNPDFTGRENVYFNASLLGLNKAEIDAVYDEIVMFADIGEFINQPVKTYSSGMAVRLAFAVQALVPKEILIVDEALAVGDELFQRKCFAKINEFRGQGGTVLFVSHSGTTIIELCDWAIFLDAGEVLMKGPSKMVVNLYQKYSFAPPRKKEEIRLEIKSVLSTLQQTSAAMNNRHLTDPNPEVAKEKTKAFYDEGLIPKQTVRYESRGAHIVDSQITTLAGERVNILHPDERYIWKYTVQFDADCENVRFGMLIKTPSGLEIGGANDSRAGDGIPCVKSGTQIKVEFTFKPSLNPGTYFMNAGVLGIATDGELYLDRLIDAAAFKILPNEDSLSTAIVDFGIVPDVIVSEATGSQLVGRR